ncbi:hypothetical protein OSTOST_24809, partial [Ostertagia ostertagi]
MNDNKGGIVSSASTRPVGVREVSPAGQDPAAAYDVYRGRSPGAIHGLPEQIVADNGPQLVAKDFRDYCRRRNVELIFIPPYHHNLN